MMSKLLSSLALFAISLLVVPAAVVQGFAPPAMLIATNIHGSRYADVSSRSSRSTLDRSLLILSASDDDDQVEYYSIGLGESDQGVLGGLGTFAALITLYSEFTLKTTGCGLPAGPFGLVGLVEGLSYLGVTGIAAFALVTKVKSVRVLRVFPIVGCWKKDNGLTMTYS
jgi:hypothetical protein